MDMKKILQTLDTNVSKAKADGNSMKKFLQIVEGTNTANQQSEPLPEITSKVLNVKEGSTPGMFGKYFKTIEQEFAESAERSKDRARLLAERVIERIVPGQEPAPGINRLTGKPMEPAATPEPAATAPATLPGKDLPTVDAASRDKQTVTINGQEYEMVHLPEGGIRPRGGVKYKIPLAMLGIRSIGSLIGILVGGKVYVLPKGEQ